MGNIQIHFTETFNVFRLLKGITAIWEGSNILKLYSVEVYQTYKFATLEENIWQKRLSGTYDFLNFILCLLDLCKFKKKNSLWQSSNRIPWELE